MPFYVIGFPLAWQCTKTADWWAVVAGPPSSSGAWTGLHFSIFCPTAFAMMASLPSNVPEWPALSSTTAAGCYGPFAVLDGGPEDLQPDPHHRRYLVNRSLLYP